MTHPDNTRRRFVPGTAEPLTVETAAYPISQQVGTSTRLLPQTLPADAAGAEVGPSLWRFRLVLLGSITVAVVLAVAVALAVRPTEEGKDAGVPRPTPTAPVVSAESPASTESTTAAPEDPPVVTHKSVTKTVTVPFASRTVKARQLPRGVRKVRVKGVPGTRRETYEIAYRDGTETDRRLVSSVVVTKPVTEVVAIGTRKLKPAR